MSALVVLDLFCGVAVQFCAALVLSSRPKSRLHLSYALGCIGIGFLDIVIALRIALVDAGTARILASLVSFGPYAVGLAIVAMLSIVQCIQPIGKRYRYIILISTGLLTIGTCVYKLILDANASIAGNQLAQMPQGVRYGVHGWLLLLGLWFLAKIANIIPSIENPGTRKRVALPLYTFAIALILANTTHLILTAAKSSTPNLNGPLLSLALLLGVPLAMRMQGNFFDAKSAVDAIVNNMSDAVFLLDENKRIQETNLAAQRLTGINPQENVDRPISDLLVWDRTSAGAICDGQLSLEDGKSIPVWVSEGTLYTDKEQLGTCLFVRDSSLRQEMIGALSLSSRLAALGQLAGSATHDLRNALTVISGYADFCREALPIDHPAHPEINAITNACTQAREIAAPLLAFSRAESLTPHPVDLISITLSTISMLRGPLGADINIIINTPPKPIICQADPTALHQILVNIAVNAREAMPQGGTLTITITSNHEQATNPYVNSASGCIRITDTGPGINEKLFELIFEPFFTTKDPSVHTGMGLAEVSGLIARMKGSVRVTNVPNGGACFELYIPLAESTFGTMRDEGTPDSLPHTRNLPQALIIAPQLQELEHLIEVASAVGYVTRGVGNWESALNIIRDHSNRLDLVISSVSISHLDPAWFEQIARRIRSDFELFHYAGHSRDLPDVPAERILYPPLTSVALLTRLHELGIQ